MSKKVKMILVLVVIVAVWAGGVWYLYNSYKTPRTSGPNKYGWSQDYVPVYRDPKTGEFVEKSFIQVKGGHLVLLTLLCGGAALFAIWRGVKRPTEEDEYDGNLRL